MLDETAQPGMEITNAFCGDAMERFCLEIQDIRRQLLFMEHNCPHHIAGGCGRFLARDKARKDFCGGFVEAHRSEEERSTRRTQRQHAAVLERAGHDRLPVDEEWRLAVYATRPGINDRALGQQVLADPRVNTVCTDDDGCLRRGAVREMHGCTIWRLDDSACDLAEVRSVLESGKQDGSQRRAIDLSDDLAAVPPIALEGELEDFSKLLIGEAKVTLSPNGRGCRKDCFKFIRGQALLQCGASVLVKRNAVTLTACVRRWIALKQSYIQPGAAERLRETKAA